MHSGMVAVIGRPNVGKSSLVNTLVGEKVSIVTRKPQTTRHQVRGVLHRDDGQAVFVDTPGLHRRVPRALNRYLNATAIASLAGIDLALWVIEAGRWNDEDEAVGQALSRRRTPVGLAVNKVDRVRPRTRLLPELERHAARREFTFIVPVSARTGDNVEALADEILRRLPEGPPLYPTGQHSDGNQRFDLAEIVREKLMSRLLQELPYATTVEVTELHEAPGRLRIEAVVWVERESQKGIVIGEGGRLLKAVGTAARREMERRFGVKVMLTLWTRSARGWTDDPAALRRLGYVAPT